MSAVRRAYDTMATDSNIPPDKTVKLVSRLSGMLAKLPRWCEMFLFFLLIWVGVGLAWLILSPAPGIGNLGMPAQHAARKQDAAALLAWFDSGKAEVVAAPPPDLKLIAVIAGARGVALLGGIEASTVAVRVGSEFRAGSRLLEVLPDRVVIEQNGARQEIVLTASAPVGVLIASAPAQLSNKPATSLSRGQFSQIIQGGNLAGWDKGLSSYRDGGIQVDDAAVQPVAKLLKLQNGDVMKQVNDRPLKQLADISLVYNALSKNPSVEITVLRNGSQQTQRYQITP